MAEKKQVSGISARSQEPGKRRPRVLFSIGVKLILIFSIIIFAMLIAVNILVSEMVSRDLLVTAEEDNFTVNSRSAVVAEYRINMVRSDAHILLDIVNAAGKGSAQAKNAAAIFFERSFYIAAIIIPGNLELINDQFFINNEVSPGSVLSWVSREAPAIQRARQGEPVVINPSAELGVPLTALFYPWQRDGSEEAVIILFSPDNLAEVFGTGYNSSFMLNADGDVLVHTDYRMVWSNSNISNHPLYAALTKTDARDISLVFTENGTRFFGAGRKLSLGGLMVFTAIEYDLPFERTSASVRRNIFLIISAMFVSIILIWLLSRTITDPVRRLTDAVSRIEAGQFDLDLKYRFPDEVGVLSGRFSEMGTNLAKREQFLNAFGRFTNPKTIEQLKNTDIPLTGEKRQVAVLYVNICFFSDIYQKLSPERLITLLNDYFSKMADAVEKNGGVVDRHVQDTFTAAWGAPLSAGNIETDAYNCVLAAVNFRKALWDFNARWGSEKYHHVRIGCGIDSGELVAGQIGISSRKDYSFIGAPLKIASKIESVNRRNGTDILVSEKTWNLVADKFIAEEMPSIQIRGEAAPRRIFAIINEKAANPEEQKGPKTLEEVREFLGIPKPEKP